MSEVNLKNESRPSRSTLTDWFAHEVRNALGPFVTEDIEIDWTQDDFKQQRRILTNFLANAFEKSGEVLQEGELNRNQIRSFTLKATNMEWSTQTARKLYSEFKEMYEKAK